MFMGVSDELLETFVPILVYWVYSGMYVALTPYLEKYRLYTKEEEESKNMITKGEVIRGVLLGQLSQVAFVFLAFSSHGKTSSPPPLQPSVLKMAFQFAIAIMVMDTWQYFTHRLLHTNFLYKHFHSKHHRLVIPYAYGALYNQPLEAIFIDTLGGVLAFLAAGMTPRTTMFFLSFASAKTVDDHCGFWIPWNPFQFLFTNNSAAHGVHHQLYGNKFNYAAPFFLGWDKLMGTYLPCTVHKREDGCGYVAKVVKINTKNI